MVDKVKEMLAISDEDSFVKRSVFSSEFLLILLYIGLISVNTKVGLDISEVNLGYIREFVIAWAFGRQIGKAVSYQKTNGGSQ